MYTLFLSGGIFASLPYGEQLIQSLATTSVTPSASPSLLGSIWSTISKTVVKPATGLLSQLAKALGLTVPIYCCGSSGAVSALMGCSFIYDTRDLVELVWRLVNEQSGERVIKGGKLERRGTSGSRLSVSTSNLMLKCIFSAPRMLFVVSYVLQELNAIQAIAINSSGWQGWLSWFAPQDNVNHNAHLQGLAFGAIVGLGSLVFRRRIIE